MDGRTMLFHCLIYNGATVATLLALVGKNPRFMMQDYPEEITRDVAPQTREEKRGAMLWGLPFLASLLLYPLGFAVFSAVAGGAGFLQNAMATGILLFSFNLIDLVIVDWLVFCTITPEFIVIPGTDGHPGYRNYRYHFLAFLKGTVFSVAGALLFAGISAGVAWIV